jgi:hypothetical protein
MELPSVSREIVTGCLAVIDGLAPLIDRIDGELHQHAKADPRVNEARRASRQRRVFAQTSGAAARWPPRSRGSRRGSVPGDR